MLKILAANNKVSIMFPWKKWEVYQENVSGREVDVGASKEEEHLCWATLTCPLLSPDQFDFIGASAPS